MGEEITPYLVVMNAHGGICSVKACMTPVRVVCQNTLNLALNRAKRIWSARHTEQVLERVDEAKRTLQLAETYMLQLGQEGADTLAKHRLTDRKVLEYMKEFFPVTEDMTDIQKRNNRAFWRT